MNQSIINCEIAFKRCFSEWVETEQLIRFRDSRLADMYEHNMTLIKTQGRDMEDIRSCILSEARKSAEEGLGFSKSSCDGIIERSELESLPGEPDITYYGFYLLGDVVVDEWKENRACRAVIAESQRHIDNLLALEIENYGQECGVDFCTRRIKRTGEVYLTPWEVDCCLIYCGRELVGKCELFLDNGTAKIENFDVKVNSRNQYIGTTLLKFAVNEAHSRGADKIYLVTDEEDTVKNMYQNLGFQKIGVWTEIFWPDVNTINSLT